MRQRPLVGRADRRRRERRLREPGVELLGAGGGRRLRGARRLGLGRGRRGAPADARRAGIRHRRAGDGDGRTGQPDDHVVARGSDRPRAGAAAPFRRAGWRARRRRGSRSGPDLGGAVVHHDRLAVSQPPRGRGEHAEVAVEPVGLGEAPRRGDHVAARAVPARRRRARARPAARRRHAPPARGRAPATLRTRTSRPPGSIASRSPAPTLPDHRVPVTTVPMPRSENTRSTGSRNGAVGRRGRHAARRAVEAGPQLVQADAGPRRDLNDRRLREEGPAVERLARPRAARARPVVVDEVALGQRDDAGGACRAAGRCRRCSRVCGMTPSSAATTSRTRSMPVAPATIAADEALVAGHVDEPKRAGRSAERRGARSRARW